MMAAKSLLKYKFEDDFASQYMNIFSLRMHEKDFGKKKIHAGRKAEDQPELNEEILKNTVELIKKHVEQISNGEFHLSILENRESVVCRYCSFKSVCRVEEYLN